ncbi:hypothetical protein H2248_002157 [Termitomyces sp. 'cryptogamus']|nr:hypothetical protein H2248_002157 [Termitomyces sp. 'cryptogamus']
MPRRSARLAGSSSAVDSDVRLSAESPTHPSPTTVISDDEDLPQIDLESSDEEPIRHKKRQKQPKSNNSSSHPSLQFKNVRGRRGALKDIVEMPLDILQEIFMYLTPVEVLSLSRMCKSLRRILISKLAECIWKQARLNLDDFPDCPDDINEVQFANLIFGAFCDYCNKKKRRYFIWSNRRCCCGACIKDKNGLIKFCLLPDAWEMDKYFDWRSILPSINPRSKTETCPPYQNDEKLKHTSRTFEHGKPGHRKNRMKENVELPMVAYVRNDIAQLDEIRQRRYEAIKRRLTDLGWEKELETIKGMKDWPSVRQPKDLTDRTWNNIKDDIIAKLEAHRAYRLEKDYLAAQCDRRSLLKLYLRGLEQKILGKVIFPDAFVLESTQQISALIKAPVEEIVEFPESLVLELVQNWRQSTDAEIRDMIIAGSTNKHNAVDPLTLATTFFRCWQKYDCSQIQYPEILNHRCATSISYNEKCLWNADGKGVFFSHEAHSLAKNILEASGLDPETTTREDVKWPEFYVECHECPSERLTGGKRLFMAWPEAVSHTIS